MTSITKKAIITASLLLFSDLSRGEDVVSNSQTATPLDRTSEVLKLQALLQQQEFLAVDFEQKIVRALRPNRARTSKGKAYFAKPNRFLWAQSTPVQEHLIYDGKILVQYRPQAKVATRFRNSANLRLREVEEVVAMVLQPESLLSRYSVIDMASAGTLVTVSFKPREKNQISKIKLTIAEATKTVHSVHLDYTNGNTWAVAFSNSKSASLKDDLFQFKPTAGTNVTDL